MQRPENRDWERKTSETTSQGRRESTGQRTRGRLKGLKKEFREEELCQWGVFLRFLWKESTSKGEIVPKRKQNSEVGSVSADFVCCFQREKERNGKEEKQRLD